jgi:ATP-binding protein involved in chromosome partitioning
MASDIELQQKLMRALRGVAAPQGSDIVTAGLVESLQVEKGLVHVALRAERSRVREMEAVAGEARDRLRAEAGVLNATVVLTAHRAEQAAAPVAVAHGHGSATGETFLPGVKRVIAVASGKGGVGKSTVAVNLAIALRLMGLRVGLIDADIYGPSLARMLGVTGKPEVRDKTMIPVEVFGLSTMSMAFLVPEEQAMIWRGPMVMGALQQLLGQTEWGVLDAMVVDLPPGTGDAQLTLSQRVNLAGAVIVSTPQDIALLDARRGVEMFRRVKVPILGIVENMSAFICPNCGHEAHIFGHGGARAEAARLGVPFLGEVPLLLDVREAGDNGRPITLAAPDGAPAQVFQEIARLVWESVG